MTDVYFIRHSLIVSVPRTVFPSCSPGHLFCFVAQECVRVLACMCAHSRTYRGAIAPPSFKDLGKIKLFWAVRRKYLGKTIIFQAVIRKIWAKSRNLER